MIISQISDTHLDPAEDNGAARLRDLERVVAAINALDPLPDVVIHTGDMAHNGTPEKYRSARSALDKLRPPLYVAAGNRDDRADLEDAFPGGRDLMPGMPFRQYAVDAFPVRLIALDTLHEGSNMGGYCQDRADNLRAALDEQPEKRTVLFMHHPPFVVSASKYTHQFADWDGVGRLERALEGQKQVIRAFTGHAHRDAGGEIAGVPVSSIPSVAIDLRLGDFADDWRDKPLFQLHRLDAGAGFTSELRAAA